MPTMKIKLLILTISMIHLNLKQILIFISFLKNLQENNIFSKTFWIYFIILLLKKYQFGYLLILNVTVTSSARNNQSVIRTLLNSLHLNIPINFRPTNSGLKTPVCDETFDTNIVNVDSYMALEVIHTVQPLLLFISDLIYLARRVNSTLQQTSNPIT